MKSFAKSLTYVAMLAAAGLLFGQQGTQLVRLTTDGNLKLHLSWAPDGSKLAFTMHKDGQISVYVVNVDPSTSSGQGGTAPKRLLQDRSPHFEPSWSPDGKKIAFVFDTISGTDGELDIRVMNADGSDMTPLITGKGFDLHPVFSPDGKKIAFTSTREGNQEIYVADADPSTGSGQGGKNMKRLTNNPTMDAHPEWSPDGSKIAFHSDRDGNYEIYVMNADGTNVVRLTDHPALDINPVWSPDGKQIAFTSNRDGNYEIYVMNADGSNQTNLTNHPGVDNYAAFKPDGKAIAFVSNRSGKFDIYLLSR